MNNKNNASPHGGGMALNDIYFILFRHKWAIIILSCLGFAVAGGFVAFSPITYQSEANLLIKYVMSNKPKEAQSDDKWTSVDGGSEGILVTEVAILNSYDLAVQVATNLGPEKILGKGATDPVAAANVIREGLTVDRFARSPVLRLMFSHPDSRMVQPILTEIIADYEKMHENIHHSTSPYDSLVRETDSMRDELQQTEEALRREKVKVNVNDLPEAKRVNAAAAAQNHQETLLAETDLAFHQEMLAKLKHSSGKAVATNEATSTNELAEIPQDKIDDYKKTTDLLDKLSKAYSELQMTFKEGSPLMKDKKVRIDELEKKKNKMEKDEPRLASAAEAKSKSSNHSDSSGDHISSEEAMVAGLKAKVKLLQTQMSEISTNSLNYEKEEATIVELDRRRQIQDQKYRDSYSKLEQAKFDQELGNAKNASIETTQQPSPPSRERSKTPKMAGAAAAAGIVLGLAWAFLMELYFDHSIKRAKEIETNLGLRLFLSIPKIKRNGHDKKVKGLLKDKDAEHIKEAPGEGAGLATVNGSTNGKMEVAPWEHSHALHQYNEALRDRLISYFEANNLNHKPKLIAVTGAAKGTGTTTIASGLAASLSETGDGNVLLIDMNMENGGAQQFYKGKPGCELDDALVNETRDTAMVQSNLYVVNGRTNGDKLSMMLPKRFANLIPKLKASDYDYIIFDMPPVARTGVTQRLSGFMDMMLLVVEAEKTHRDIVRQASALLTESKANVSVVLNKTQTYIPERLHQDF